MSTSAKDPVAPSPESIKILVVDKNPQTRDATVQLVKQSGERSMSGHRAERTIAICSTLLNIICNVGRLVYIVKLINNKRPIVGYRTDAVASAHDAFQYLESAGCKGIDLILKEHDPPVSNAARFLQNLQKEEKYRAIPCIGMFVCIS